ncbi:MAG: hypothetical protein ACRDRO_20765 [Pseudonocardiaceae bacterium]
MSSEQSFVSTSLTRHIVRGVVGFGTLIGSVALIPLVGPLSLLLAPIGLVALRGCPMCWVIGLVETVSMGRLQRSCVDGRCELSVADRTPPHAADQPEPNLEETTAV